MTRPPSIAADLWATFPPAAQAVIAAQHERITHLEARIVERVRTVVASCRQQGRNVLAFLVDAVQAARTGTAVPSRVPAGV